MLMLIELKLWDDFRCIRTFSTVPLNSPIVWHKLLSIVYIDTRANILIRLRRRQQL